MNIREYDNVQLQAIKRGLQRLIDQIEIEIIKRRQIDEDQTEFYFEFDGGIQNEN